MHSQFLSCFLILARFCSQSPPQVNSTQEPKPQPGPAALISSSVASTSVIPAKQAAANLIQKVDPVYPPLAKAAKLQGVVRLRATVTPDGQLTNLEVVSAHPLLVQSALNAVRKWKYKPFLQDGLAVEVRIEIEVPFILENFDQKEWDRYQQTFKLQDRGWREFRSRDYAAAEKTFSEDLQLAETLAPERFFALQHALQGLGAVYLVQKRYGEAVALFERALSALEKNLKPDEAEVAGALKDLGDSYRASGEPEKAAPLYERAVSIWEARRADTGLEELKYHYGRSLTFTMNSLGIIYFGRGDETSAESSFRRALAIGETVCSAEELQPVFANYESLLNRNGRVSEVPKLEERLEALRKKPMNRKPSN